MIWREIIKPFLRPYYRYIMRLDAPWNSPGLRSCFFPGNYFLARKWPEIPFRQLSAYNSLLMTLDLADELGVRLYASHGTLLGAVRAGGFAGRPKDLDFYISAEDFQTVEDNIALIKARGFRFNKCKSRKGVVHMIPPTGVFISFTIYRQTGEDGRLERDNDYFVQREAQYRQLGCQIDDRPFDIDWRNDAVGMHIMIARDTKKDIFRRKVLVPDNYIALLEKQYGQNWKTPSGTQYS